jgi:uncharacterized protein involved in tolerance to divalent cations
MLQAICNLERSLSVQNYETFIRCSYDYLQLPQLETLKAMKVAKTYLDWIRKEFEDR